MFHIMQQWSLQVSFGSVQGHRVLAVPLTNAALTALQLAGSTWLSSTWNHILHTYDRFKNIEELPQVSPISYMNRCN